MCLITRVPELDLLFTSANVKIILEGVDCTCNVRTLLVDMDPTLHSLDNSIPCCHAWSFRQRTGLAYLLQTLETTWSRSSFTHCCLVARHHCRLTLLNTHLHVLRADCWCSSAALTSSVARGGVDFMSSAFVSLSRCADSWCASGTPHDRLFLHHLVPLRFTRSLVLSGHHS